MVRRLIPGLRRYPAGSPPPFRRTAPVSLPRRLTQPENEAARLPAARRDRPGDVHLSRV